MERRCQRCTEWFESDRPHHRLCWTCFWEIRDAETKTDPPRQPSRAASGALDPGLLLEAIALTHPDKHPPERARAANAVTAALLEALHSARQAGRR